MRTGHGGFPCGGQGVAPEEGDEDGESGGRHPGIVGVIEIVHTQGSEIEIGLVQRFHDQVRISAVIGDVTDRDVIVLDDEIAKGSTVIELVDHLHQLKARSIRLVCTHGLFADDALERLAALDGVREIVCTNTVPIPVEKRVPQLTVLSIAPALAEAMRRIHNGESVSALFA